MTGASQGRFLALHNDLLNCLPAKPGVFVAGLSLVLGELTVRYDAIICMARDEDSVRSDAFFILFALHQAMNLSRFPCLL